MIGLRQLKANQLHHATRVLTVEHKAWGKFAEALDEAVGSVLPGGCRGDLSRSEVLLRERARDAVPMRADGPAPFRLYGTRIARTPAHENRQTRSARANGDMGVPYTTRTLRRLEHREPEAT